MPDHCGTAAWPLVCKKQRLPRWDFRSSIAWLPDWLSTLRGVSYLSTTQDSLPVAGQALPRGISTRKVPLKGFKVVNYISFPFPKLSWRKPGGPGSLPTRGSHRPVRAHIRAYGSSTDRFAIRDGPRSYPIELR